MDHLSAAGSSATRNLTTTEPSESLNRRKTVDFRFQRPYATSGSFFFNKPMRAMDSRRDFTSKKVFPGHFSELGEKANSGLSLKTSFSKKIFACGGGLKPLAPLAIPHKIRILAQNLPPVAEIRPPLYTSTPVQHPLGVEGPCDPVGARSHGE